MMKLLKRLAPALVLGLPMIALAQFNTTNIGGLSDSIVIFLGNRVVPLIFAVAVVLFLWGLIKYLTSGGDEAKQKEGRSMIIWGIVVIAVMASVWGLVHLLQDSFNLANTPVDFPPIPTR